MLPIWRFWLWGIDLHPCLDRLQGWGFLIPPSLAANIGPYGLGCTCCYLVQHHVHLHCMRGIQRCCRGDEFDVIVVLGGRGVSTCGTLQNRRLWTEGGRWTGECHLCRFHPVTDIFDGDFRRGSTGKFPGVSDEPLQNLRAVLAVWNETEDQDRNLSSLLDNVPR
ncbi:hypothetical protein CDAR_55841 [Caerostris darwini]|uniref:Uncharacterized protein n=1 Tax=Caerostris darwini TaxID=1538125 RepID=A0AAV4V895_9ARAC|nr:hypothetical protein CDAR_55841 [Caerostris darwini]